MTSPTGTDASRSPAVESVGIVGAGAMGAMYAQHFAESGFDTSFVATGERARLLRERPVTANGRTLSTGVIDPEALEQPRTVDLLLFAVKDAGLADAVETAAPLVGEHTTVLSVMNGLSSEATIAARVGAEKVLACVGVAMDAQRSPDGDTRDIVYHQAGRLDLGVLPGVAEAGPERRRALQEALDRAGLAWSLVDEPGAMEHTMWWKFMVNTGVNQASAAMRLPYGAFVDEGPARSLMWALIDEVVQVAAAEGVTLDEADLARWDEVLAGQPADGRTSMHQDVEAGRATETDMFAGHVIELGAEHQIPTPYNQAVSWILQGIGQRLS